MVTTRVSEGTGVNMPGIIVGVDGSAHSQWALEWGMSEAASRHAPLTALAVHHRGAVGYAEDGLNLDQVVEEVQAIVDKAASHQSGPFLPVTVKVATGLPAAELIGASRNADLLVVGSRGSGGLGRRGVGSVSSRVASGAHCPVIIIFQPTGTHLTARGTAVKPRDTQRSPALATAAAAVSQP
jgi:nucleotide-binding universal stress UspA family protein